MNPKIKNIFFLLSLFTANDSFGQMNQYEYKRKLININSQWHKVVLPNDVFGKINADFSDIRIFGITQTNDTLEAPFVLRHEEEKNSRKEVAFNLINDSKNNRGYFFTFEMPVENAVNQMQLEFKQKNFDWKLTLEGSQNQLEWFSIIEDYRILSIKNEYTDYQFTKVGFPDSKFRYFRMHIKSELKPELISAKIALNEIIVGNLLNYPNFSTEIIEQKQDKQTIIKIDLKTPVPVCNLKIVVIDTIDYYRSLTIFYFTDSIKTQQGWKYNYSTLMSGTLNSMEKNSFIFNSTILQKLKITINNQDNQPLKIDSLVVNGCEYEIIGRFDIPATYYLVYGDVHALRPNYDLDRFTDQIPTAMTDLKLEEEQLIDKKDIHKTEPLFQNKIWLWIVMTLIISLLGWFSLKMINKKL